MAAFEYWHGSAVENKITAAKVNKVISRWVNHYVGQAMHAWHFYTEEEARKRNQEHAKEQRGKAVMRRVVKRMQHATLASGLLRWWTHVEELRRQQGILERVASRMRNGTVCKAFARWDENAKELRQQQTPLKQEVVYVDRLVEVEKLVYVDKPQIIEKVVYVDKPVEVEKLVYVDKPQIIEKVYVCSSSSFYYSLHNVV